jgi:probable F420-dependent oxidoreductase
VKLGLGLPQRKGVDLRTDVTHVARTAEQAGFDSLWVYERLLFPTNPAGPLYGIPGLDWPACYEGGTADPLTVLAAAAAVTDTIRLGSSVLVTPLHIPVQLAKALATIDNLSGGGRLIAGFGSGWSADEMQAAGVSLADRGRSLDETLDVCAAVWGPDPVRHQGLSVIPESLISPKPVSRIPVMIGGGFGGAAMDRVARRADGWLPTALPPAALSAMWGQIREAAAGYGRDAAAMELIYRANIILTDGPAGADRQPFVGSMDQIVEDAVALAGAGATELIIELQLDDGFAGTKWLLDTALEIRERARAGGV